MKAHVARIDVILELIGTAVFLAGGILFWAMDDIAWFAGGFAIGFIFIALGQMTRQRRERERGSEREQA